MEKFVLAAKSLIIFLAIFIIVSCSWYKYEMRPISDSVDKVEVIVNKGDTWYSVGTTLQNQNLIRSLRFYKLYIKLFTPSQLEAGIYFLSPSMSLEEIVNELEQGSTHNIDDIAITFQEGINMRGIAKIISDNTNNTYESIFELMEDDEYINELINNYWFLTNDIKNSKIYYPLEGYLFPETYIINKNNNVKEIFKLMLDETDKKLTDYKESILNSKYSVHELMTLSSIIELEAGNSNDRSLVAGVFYNRLNKSGETLGSDVTGYYGAKMDDWSNGLGSARFACNGYNTRLESTCPISGLPVGPICNPGITSIKAALNPTETDNYFFVADCDGKTYLTKNNSEHEAIIQKLKNEGKWCDQ